MSDAPIGGGFLSTPSQADIRAINARLDRLEAQVFPPEPLVKDTDVRIDVWTQGRATAVVSITHLPTGLCVRSDSHWSQLRNKAEALAELEAKLRTLGWTPDQGL